MKNFMYKTVVRDTIPCLYEIGWQANPPAILLRVHQDFIKNNTLVANPELPIIKSLQKEFGFKKFCGDLNGHFGFDDAFVHQGEKNDFTEYLILLPKIKKETGKKCPDCRGKGKKKDSGYSE